MSSQQVRAQAFQPLHRHADHRLVVFLGGDMEENSFGGGGRFQRGDFVFRPAWFAHADRACDAATTYTRLTVPRSAALDWISRHGWRAARGRIDLTTRFPTGCEVLQSVSAQAYAESVGALPLQRAAHILATDPHSSVAAVAARFGLEACRFSRDFKRAHGLTPVAYRRQARLQRALRMVFERSHSLAVIAADCGFHDQSQLTHEVRRETGTTPGELARAARL